MKVIHCADLHLDSPMNSFLPTDKARVRRDELLLAFNKMIDYAKEEGVSAIIIAGDLFDKKKVSANAAGTVMNAITSNSDIAFYYLKGNHDDNLPEQWMGNQPENLYLFGNEWTKYELEPGVVLSGVEFGNNNQGAIYESLNLGAKDINIVTMHGQENIGRSGDKTEIVDLNRLKNKFIDYLALGHIHSYKRNNLDNRGLYSYSGCLAGRGFDEVGEHGFVLLDIDSEHRKITDTFVVLPQRCIHEVGVDVSDCFSSSDVSRAIENVLTSSKIPQTDIVKFILNGTRELESDINLRVIEQLFENRFYFVRVKDESKFKVDYDSFEHDESLKGEFVRLVKADSRLSDEDKANIIRLGINALKGEEVFR